MRGFKWIYVKNKARSTSIKSITNTYFVVITLIFLRYITYYLQPVLRHLMDQKVHVGMVTRDIIQRISAGIENCNPIQVRRSEIPH